jgi:SAM-dependent methyltransferase
MTQAPVSPGEAKDAIASPPVGRYFQHLRRDVLALVPKDARAVLSVGCGAGATEEVLVRRGCSVTGIEPDAGAAGLARGRGLEVLEGTTESTQALLFDRRFDCVIYADVLEHILDPLAVLMAHRPLMTSGCVVVISVPNFRHFTVLHELFIRGYVRYRDAGILDRTHLRLTTRRMVEEWMESAGIIVERTVYQFWRRYERTATRLSFRALDPFLARQVLVRGRATEL